jgi:hypothetical protein
MKYAFEREWRSIRMLHRMERVAGDVFLSTFDPASVCEIIIRRECAVETALHQLLAEDVRYRHAKMFREK